MVDQRSAIKGYWSLICDSDAAPFTCITRIKAMSESLKRMQKKFPEMFPIPPGEKKLREIDNLLVHTSDDSEDGIRKSAEAIRSSVDYPYFMYYFKNRDSNSMNRRALCRHSPDNELYKDNINDAVEKCDWKLISKKTKPTDDVHGLLPSQVTDREHIYLPSNEEEFLASSAKGGKWMLQCPDWETHGNLWKNLIRLYDRGVLVGLKSCTKEYHIEKINPIYDTKAIFCYTANADCKSCVKRAADSIFICTGYKISMYYKSNEASRDGKYRHEGSFAVTKYMYTETGVMYERDNLNRWKKCIFDEEMDKHISMYNQVHANRCNCHA